MKKLNIFFKRIKTNRFLICLLFTFSLFHSFTFSLYAAPDLTATIAIEQTAETAFAAKSSAMNKARRQIFNTVLSRYADGRTIEDLSLKMTDAQLLNMIGMTSISDEKTSATSYSANITMTLDPAATERWLSDNNVPNYMAATGDTGPRITVLFEFSGGLRQWIALNQGLRNSGFPDTDLKLSSMLGKKVTGTIPSNRRGAFVSALRNTGWNVSDTDGILKATR